jgi:succinoglycan biosynthesis transport protein ExoP
MSDGLVYSPPVVLENDSPLPPRGQHDGLTLVDLWHIFRKRIWIILALVAAFTALGAVYSSTRVRLYEGTATVDLNPSSTNMGLSDLIQESLSSEDVRLPTEVQRMQSNQVIFGTIKRLALEHKGPFPHLYDHLPASAGEEAFPAGEMEGMISGVRGGLSISVEPDTDIVAITFRDPRPEVARDVPNTLVRVYLDRNLADHMQGTGRVTQWLASEMNDLRKQADEAQARLAEYQRQHNLIGGPQSDELVLDRLRTENGQIAGAEADRIMREAKLRIVESNDPDLIATAVPSPTLSALRSEQLGLQAQYDQLTTKYGTGYPRVRELQAQIASLRQRVNAEMRNVQSRIQNEYNTSVRTGQLLQQQLNQQMQSAYQLNQSAAQYALMRQDAESTRRLYDQLQLKLKESNLAAGLNTASVSVIDEAMLPLVPVTPNTRMNITVSGAFGLMVGLILSFLLDTMDDTLRTTEDVESFSGLLSIGAIPHLQTGMRGRGTELAESRPGLRLVSMSAPASPAAEAYRALRSSILLSAIDNPLKAVVVTSAFMSEGKSTLSANLAVMLAQRGERVLIVDADLRRSTLHLLFGMERPQQGLTSLLSRQSGDSVYLRPLRDLPELTYLPAGVVPPNPAELLASHRMAEMLHQWSQEYDRVILDTAPILAVSDSLALAARSDSVLLVVRAGVTRKKALLRTRELLRRVNAHLLGVVVNDVDLRKESYYDYSGPYTYGYGYGYTGEPEHEEAKR